MDGVLATWAGISSIVGLVMSYVYEKLSKDWHGKDVKFWAFFGLCIIAGGLTGLSTGEISFEPLAWNSYEMVFLSLSNILKWVGGFLIAGQAWFKTVVHK